jgi:hypothetical protein
MRGMAQPSRRAFLKSVPAALAAPALARGPDHAQTALA